MLALSGCNTNRELDPDGVYGGDRALWEFDGALLAYSEITQELLEIADRHPVAVSEKEEIAEFVSEIRQNRRKVISEAGDIRLDYLAANAVVGDLRGQERALKIAIELARRYLLEIARSDQARIGPSSDRVAEISKLMGVGL